LYAGTLVDVYGYGGLKVVHEITGMSENTIRVGRNEIKNGTVSFSIFSTINLMQCC
jgi:hypothetical protein